MRIALLAAILVVLAAPAGSQAAACTHISGRFAAVPGSAGAGNIVYALRLRNTGSSACLLPGLPRLTLLTHAGSSPARLPTKVSRDPRYMPKPLLLKPGATAVAQARFSPDVPGPGETSTGRCEPIAHYASVGTVVVRVLPPTSVCEHGALVFTPYR